MSNLPKHSSGNSLLYHIVAIVVVSIWGSTLVSTKILMQDGMRADEVFIVRFALAYVAVLPFSSRKLWADNWRDELMMLALGVTGGSLYFITENMAVGITYVNNVSFIVSTSPLFTMVFVLLTYRYLKVKKILIIGSLLALLGIGVVIFNGQVILKLNPLGDMLSVAASLCFGVYCYLVKVMGDRYDSVFLTRKMFVYGLLTSLIILLFKPWQYDLSGLMKGTVMLNLLFLGLVASFFCFVLWNVAINKLGAVTMSNYLYLIPVTTVIFSAIFLDEPMTVVAYAGSALILIGVFLANKGCAD
ncbi:MAG: DMT family transporter [Prevotella sp.]|nr:DMT family transporter [Prevotella sp.]